MISAETSNKEAFASELMYKSFMMMITVLRNQGKMLLSLMPTLVSHRQVL